MAVCRRRSRKPLRKSVKLESMPLNRAWRTCSVCSNSSFARSGDSPSACIRHCRAVMRVLRECEHALASVWRVGSCECRFFTSSTLERQLDFEVQSSSGQQRIHAWKADSGTWRSDAGWMPSRMNACTDRGEEGSRLIGLAAGSATAPQRHCAWCANAFTAQSAQRGGHESPGRQIQRVRRARDARRTFALDDFAPRSG